MDIDFEDIKLRQDKLDRAAIYLKSQFVGIDGIIDSLMDYIQVWYLVPNLLTRPIIVNLWGMTGVGKTDLIRKLVNFLEFQDRFAEIELSNIDGTSWASSVTEKVEQYDLNDGAPCILLFDEIQRFNTLDGDGKPLLQTKFVDFWELLSDGKLSKKSKDDLDYYMMSYQLSARDIAKRKAKGEQNLDENPMIDQYEAKSLKKALRLSEGLTDLINMSQKDMLELIAREKKKKKIYEPVSHQKSLIIISGNLDEAYEMADQTSESDIDADIYHAYTKKITDVNIKNALAKKFRPEQVARFGNIHLIYTSLKKADFEKLIHLEVNRIIARTNASFGIDLEIDASIEELIYRNGVFPVQGVRPVFSTIIDILETHLAKLVFLALTAHEKTISMRYDSAHSQINVMIGNTVHNVPYAGRIDKIRSNNVVDTVANISVHECGHALAYMLLFGLVPLQLKSKIANSYAGGFTFPHEIHLTRHSLIDTIKVYLAGGVAEELIFGINDCSTGRSNDLERATAHAIDFVRRYGFDDEFKANYTMQDAYAMNKFETDTDIEKMLARLESATRELLSEHKPLLRHMSLKLAGAGQMDVTEIQSIARNHGVEARIEHEGYLHIGGFSAVLNAVTANPNER
jgi:hypothetical protein